MGETLKGKWFRTIVDLHKGSKALRIGRYVLKHLPVAVLTVLPNTFLTVVPMSDQFNAPTFASHSSRPSRNVCIGVLPQHILP